MNRHFSKLLVISLIATCFALQNKARLPQKDIGGIGTLPGLQNSQILPKVIRDNALLSTNKMQIKSNLPIVGLKKTPQLKFSLGLNNGLGFNRWNNGWNNGGGFNRWNNGWNNGGGFNRWNNGWNNGAMTNCGWYSGIWKCWNQFG